jgi:hypothetical protein
MRIRSFLRWVDCPAAQAGDGEPAVPVSIRNFPVLEITFEINRIAWLRTVAAPPRRSPDEYNRRNIVRYRDFFNPTGDFN